MNPSTQVQLIRAGQLTKMLGISSASLWRWTKDPKRVFPQPIKLGPRITVWKLCEIEAYVAARSEQKGGLTAQQQSALIRGAS